MNFACLEGSREMLTASGVIMDMSFDIARNDTSECSDEIVYLTCVGTSNSISDTDTVDTDLVYCLIDREEINEVGSE